MIQNQEDIKAAKMAASYINSTQRHVFLTGKAGTGKTTFLKQIVLETHKNAIVAAPTGIAAINAGGVTLHSLFQLPLGIFLPSNRNLNFNEREIETEIQTPASIMKTLRLNKTKRRMLQELELLIIDEVSMLRADMADAIDTVLRSVRRKRNTPFGGVQLLLIGDMQQLPPVVRQHEWSFLSPFYKSMYFFDAAAFADHKPVYIELEKIYRQHDPKFISILNNLRDDVLTDEDKKLLNSHYNPSLTEEQKEGAVFLTTHNRQADELNERKLSALPGKSSFYEAEIIGDFPDRNYPVEFRMELKEGAQIMFVKNDYSGEQRYFNGKIGKIASLSDDGIFVEFADDNDFVELAPYIWENKRYTLNQETQEIEEKIIGSFQQYPIKLAWAITVHKSQGLTFDKAIIDVSQAFAPGQAYVALSRLRSLDGLMLSKPMPESNLKADKALSDFSGQKSDTIMLEQTLRDEAFHYTKSYLLSAYNFEEMAYHFKDHLESYDKDENRSKKQQHKDWASSILQEIIPLRDTAKNFQKQITTIMLNKDLADLQHLQQRVSAANKYFDAALKSVIEKVREKRNEVASVKGAKQFRSELEEMEGWVMSKLKQFLKCDMLINSLIGNLNPNISALIASQNLLYIEQKFSIKKLSKAKANGHLKEKKQKDKTPSYEISFKLYKEGKSPKEIASERGFSITTIEGHLSQCIAKSLIPVDDLVSKKCFDEVVNAYREIGSTKLSEIRERLDRKYTYSEIRFALSGYFAGLAENN
ncbi:MAG: helix-turn-helix domain-containing protein [Candidatus Latescibacteria bacterium]|nr:helix-turn-helix domain-containing protein [Candidatus Latescibacterota bacterium]